LAGTGVHISELWCGKSSEPVVVLRNDLMTRTFASSCTVVEVEAISADTMRLLFGIIEKQRKSGILEQKV
jgi:hypothetical protein